METLVAIIRELGAPSRSRSFREGDGATIRELGARSRSHPPREGDRGIIRELDHSGARGSLQISSSSTGRWAMGRSFGGLGLAPELILVERAMGRSFGGLCPDLLFLTGASLLMVLSTRSTRGKGRRQCASSRHREVVDREKRRRMGVTWAFAVFFCKKCGQLKRMTRPGYFFCPERKKLRVIGLVAAEFRVGDAECQNEMWR